MRKALDSIGTGAGQAVQTLAAPVAIAGAGKMGWDVGRQLGETPLITDPSTTYDQEWQKFIGNRLMNQPVQKAVTLEQQKPVVTSFPQELQEQMKTALPPTTEVAPQEKLLANRVAELPTSTEFNPQEQLLPNLQEASELPKEGGGVSLYHETGASGLRDLMAYGDATGLNVSTDKDFALGQSGKGITIEIDKDKLIPDTQGKPGQGYLRPIKKPGTPIAGQKEFSVLGGRTSPEMIKSITVKKGTALDPVSKAILNRTFDKSVNENGDTIFTPKLSTPKEGIKNKLEKRGL